MTDFGCLMTTIKEIEDRKLAWTKAIEASKKYALTEKRYEVTARDMTNYFIGYLSGELLISNRLEELDDAITEVRKIREGENNG